MSALMRSDKLLDQDVDLDALDARLQQPLNIEQLREAMIREARTA